MTADELLGRGVELAFGFFAVGFLFVFCAALLLGFVDFMRRFLG